MISYRLVQNKSSNPKMTGKWYAKVVTGQTVTTEKIAERIQASCSMKKSDVVAVLSELAALTAFLTAITTTSCMGRGPF